MIYNNPEFILAPLFDTDSGAAGGGDTDVLQASIPADSGTGTGDVKVADFSIPAEYAEKGWAKDLKTNEDVFKKLDGAESLIGRQVKIPDANTPDEERNKFFEQFRPENAGDYTFNRENQTDEMKAMVDEKMDSAVKDLFYKADLAPWQAEILQQGYETEILGEVLKDTAEGKAKQNAEFDKLAKETFGENEVAIMDAANKLIEAHTPEGFGDQLKGLPNEQAMALAGLLNEIKNSYIDEGTLSTLGDSITADGEAALSEKGKALMQSEAYQNEFHPDHEKTKIQANEIYQKLGNIKK